MQWSHVEFAQQELLYLFVQKKVCGCLHFLILVFTHIFFFLSLPSFPHSVLPAFLLLYLQMMMVGSLYFYMFFVCCVDLCVGYACTHLFMVQAKHYIVQSLFCMAFNRFFRLLTPIFMLLFKDPDGLVCFVGKN